MNPINGDIFRDARGDLRFINAFDMTRVKRMYAVLPEIGVVRAWQGHRLETKWFHAAKGSFRVKTAVFDDTTRVQEIILSDKQIRLVEIAPGHFNGFEALEPGSILMVFSDLLVEESRADDYRLDTETLPW
jgi:dTDP-4-dehydrorhamnose 3,5-epimerase-like enzyme